MPSSDRASRWAPVLLLMLGGFACAFPGGGAAQAGCDPDAALSSEAPALDDYSLLFRQASVSFYAKLPDPAAGAVVEVVVRNGNAYPVEVSYGVELVVPAQQGTRSIPLGRHCARIPARGHALTRDDAPAEGSAVRVRNLTVANLSAQPPAAARSAPAAPPSPAAPAGQPVQGEAASDPRPGEGSAASTSAGVSGTPAESRAGGTEAESARVVAVPGAQASQESVEVAGPPAAARVSRTPAEASAPGTGQATAARVIRGILRGVVLLSAVVLTVAGIGILLPVLAALYAVALGVGLLARRVLRRREAGGAEGSTR